MDQNRATETHGGPASSARFILGGVLIALGLAAFGLLAALGWDAPPDRNATADGAWQALLIVGGALAIGAGALTITLALIQRRKRHEPNTTRRP